MDDGRSGWSTISIHAPRVGSDNRPDSIAECPFISIHAPRVGSDCFCVRIATEAFNFNPRSPCGERLLIDHQNFFCFLFQSTLPVWGATSRSLIDFLSAKFQSTLPVWGATKPRGRLGQIILISIHAPRVGSDWDANVSILRPDISIHAPRVGSDGKGKQKGILQAEFQSTLPVWGATMP